MVSKYSHLLSTGRIGDCEVPNRMIMAPMTRFRVTEDGVPMDANITYYSQRASAGLIITESLYVEPRGRQEPVTAGIYTDEQVSAWKRVTDGVHEAGGRIFAQLAHAGRLSHPSLQVGGVLPIAPSALAEGVMSRVADPDTGMIVPTPAVTPRAMETEEVREMVKEYGRAADRAMKAGFDGVEIHAGSGHLHRQFLQLCSNQRDDKYGGSVENRCRFLIETVEEIVGRIGHGKVGVKISPNFAYNGTTGTAEEINELYPVLAKSLSQFNLAYLHVQRAIWTMYFGDEDYEAIAEMRAHYDNLIIAGGELDRDSGEAALRKGLCDGIVFGRRFLANPDLPRRFELDAHETPWDDTKIYFPGVDGFTDYPTLEEEEAAS